MAENPLCFQPYHEIIGGKVSKTGYRNFAPFVRHTGERKAQTCAEAIYKRLANRTINSFGREEPQRRTFPFGVRRWDSPNLTELDRLRQCESRTTGRHTLHAGENMSMEPIRQGIRGTNKETRCGHTDA